MKELISSPKFIMITVALLALVVIPLTIIQSQTQQNTQQQADEITWGTNQSASTSCPTGAGGVVIKATFTNTEPKKSSTAMDVIVKDQQTGKSVDMGTVEGGETKTVDIKTGKQTLNAGSVTFSLSWTNAGSDKDSRTASYKAVSNCDTTPTTKPTIPWPSITIVLPTTGPSNTPIPSVPTPEPSATTVPSPTVCPTLGPVKNVTIECPNCP